MLFDILTIFPDLIYNYADDSILGRAQKKKLIEVRAHNFREFTTDKQRHVDDHPYGGGPGMILQVQPIFDCLKALKALRNKEPSSAKATAGKQAAGSKRFQIQNSTFKILLMDPAGKKFDQRMAEKYSKLDRLILIAGRYEGFDARIHKLVDERVSVGEYVLAGGELPALTIVEAVARLIPGVLGNKKSLEEETFGKKVSSIKYQVSSNDKIINTKYLIPNTHKEHPQYTRPENFNGWKVPKVLLSGDHGKIAEWRRKKSV